MDRRVKVTRLVCKLLQIQFNVLSEAEFRGVGGKANVAK